MRVFPVLLGIALLPFTAHAQGAGSAGRSPGPFGQRVLSIHNSERAAVGAPSLRWSVELEKGATEHAQLLARTGRLAHAPREGRGIARENLSQGLLGWGPDQLMQNWLNEKGNFRGGVYPDVCSGGWSQCSHYTQIIWPGTTDVGCGTATGGRFSWLVCRYSPGGNKDGKRLGAAVYSAPGRTKGPADSAKSRQLLGTPGQSSTQSNLEALCNPPPHHKISDDGRMTMQEAAARREALKAEMERVEAAIAAAQAELADYDPDLIEELLGTADVPPQEQLAALSKRLKELRDEYQKIQEHVKALMLELQQEQARLQARIEICRDRRQVDQ